MPKHASQRRWLIAAGFLAFAVLAGIIIKITKKDGTTLEVTVPDGTKKVEITESEISNSKSQISNSKGWHGWPADAPPPAIAPFNAEQAQQHQEAWAKYLGVPVEYTNSLGMKFRLIPPGEFLMGSTKEEIEEALKVVGENTRWQECIKSEAPQHKVILTQPIYLGIHEVTQGQYEQSWMGNNPSHFAPMGTGKDAVTGMDTTRHPVEMVSWNDAAEFCAKLSQQEKLKPFYFRSGETVTPLEGTGYRLPTAAEWEFACRAGTTTRYWSGDNDESLAQAGWFSVNAGGRTHAVGELKANAFGLYDIHGNVWEWVKDWWEPSYYEQFQGISAIDPNGPSSAGSQREIRGGSWTIPMSLCRAAVRHAVDPPTSRRYSDGFRLVLVVDAVRESLKLTGPAMVKRPKASVTDGSTSSTAKPLTPLPQLDLDETDPLPGWELPPGAPPPVVAPCEPTLATERQQLWAEFLKRPVIEELDVAALAVAAFARTRGEGADAPTKPRVLANAATNGANAATKEANAATTLKFALIPPGEFRKIFTRPRDPAIEPDMPVRRFRITKPYALSTTEVTWDQFRQFVEATGYQTEAETNGLGGRDREFKPDPKITWRTPGWKPAPNEPVTQVTPRDAEAFCAWLNLECGDSSPLSLRGGATFSFPKLTVPPQDGQPAKDKKESGDESPHSKCLYRLPTEAEWVHACRAGSVHKHVVGPEPGDLAD